MTPAPATFPALPDPAEMDPPSAAGQGEVSPVDPAPVSSGGFADGFADGFSSGFEAVATAAATPAPPTPLAASSEPVSSTPVAEVAAPLAAEISTVPTEGKPEARNAPVEQVIPAAKAAEEVLLVDSDPEQGAGAHPGPPVDDEADLRDLELRAIFSTSESFTLSLVARKVVGLPGINSCSLTIPGKFIQAPRREENRLGNDAREMVATLRSLAKLTGLPEARTFTLQTDRGIVSLFLEGDSCVAVHQESAVFQPGVREKLILIARSLAKLRE